MEQKIIFDANIDFNKPTSNIVRWGISNLIFLHDEISKGKSLNILISGCGTGRNAHYLSRLNHNIIGFDIYEKNINLAKYRYSENPVSTEFDFLVHDLKDGLPFDDGSFDLVIDIFVYNEQNDRDNRKSYIREISRVLNSDGYLLLGVHDFRDGYYLKLGFLSDTYPRVVYDPVYKKHVLCYQDEDLFEEVKDDFQVSMKWEQSKSQIIEGNNYLRKYLITLLKNI